VQQWLNAWMAGDTAAKIAMLEPETQPGSTVPDPQLLSGKINDYEPYQHMSDDEFTLLVTFQLHLPTVNESAWGEGVNSRFFTFNRADASSPFLMHLASGPPLASGYLPE
jgi:hypothetical protein